MGFPPPRVPVCAALGLARHPGAEFMVSFPHFLYLGGGVAAPRYGDGYDSSLRLAGEARNGSVR